MTNDIQPEHYPPFVHSDLFPEEKKNIESVIFDSGKSILIDVSIIIGIILILNYQALASYGIYAIFGAYAISFFIQIFLERITISFINASGKNINNISETSKMNYYRRYCAINGFLVFSLMLISYSAFVNY